MPAPFAADWLMSKIGDSLFALAHASGRGRPLWLKGGRVYGYESDGREVRFLNFRAAAAWALGA